MTPELPSTAPRTLTTPARWALQALAGVCVVLGLIGVIVPVMPTVPFLLVAAWAASRSSPRLHHWLLSHPRFGRPLREWEEARVVPRAAKWLATIMMAMSGGTMTWLATPAWRPVLVIAWVLGIALLVWLWRRPERRPGENVA